MTLLEEAIESLRSVPAAKQDQVAEVVLSIVEQYTSDLQLTPEQIEEVRRIEADFLAGKLEILSDEETKAMWRRLGA